MIALYEEKQRNTDLYEQVVSRSRRNQVELRDWQNTEATETQVTTYINVLIYFQNDQGNINI